jgi:hypothetical protein
VRVRGAGGGHNAGRVANLTPGGQPAELVFALRRRTARRLAGRTTATWDLVTERGRATLTVGREPDGGAITALLLLAAARTEVSEGS